MRDLAQKLGALLLFLGVLAFVVRASVPPAPAAVPAGPEPVASAAADAGPLADAGAPDERANKYGIMGRPTKADPHVMRRAVESLAAPASSKGASSKVGP